MAGRPGQPRPVGVPAARSGPAPGRSGDRVGSWPLRPGPVAYGELGRHPILRGARLPSVWRRRRLHARDGACVRAGAGVPCDAVGMTDRPRGRTWRLLVTEPSDGATNMAVDEAVWLGRRAGASPPTVRFFAWAPPTVSLGYGQPLDRHVDVAACRHLGVGIVRRLTGGSAIYHDGPERELTYSVVAAADDVGGGARDLLHSYQWIGRALAGGLRTLGAPVEMVGVARGDEPTPAFCFARTGSCELEVGGRKLVGSAQRRYGGTFLQHGSILLGVDAARLAAIFPT